MCENCKKNQEEKKCENLCNSDDLRFTFDEFLPMVKDGLKLVFEELSENEPNFLPILSKACLNTYPEINKDVFGNLGNILEKMSFESKGIERKRDGNQYKILVDVKDFKPEDFDIEINRETRMLTIEAKHEVSETEEEGTSKFFSNTMRFVETIPNDIDIFGLKKEFVGKQLVISGYVEQGGKCENIVKL